MAEANAKESTITDGYAQGEFMRSFLRLPCVLIFPGARDLQQQLGRRNRVVTVSYRTLKSPNRLELQHYCVRDLLGYKPSPRSQFALER